MTGTVIAGERTADGKSLLDIRKSFSVSARDHTAPVDRIRPEGVRGRIDPASTGGCTVGRSGDRQVATRRVRRYHRESPSATSRQAAPSSGAAPIVQRGWWWNTPHPTSSRTCCAAQGPRRSTRAISPPASSSRICPPTSASSIASASRILRICERSARRRSAAFARRRMRSARATSRWRGRPTRSGRDGESIPTGAACGCIGRCATRSRTSSFTAATPSTPTA